MYDVYQPLHIHALIRTICAIFSVDLFRHMCPPEEELLQRTYFSQAHSLYNIHLPITMINSSAYMGNVSLIYHMDIGVCSILNHIT